MIVYLDRLLRYNLRMSKTEIIQELPKLRPEERQEIRAKLNELDGVPEEAWIDESELTAGEKRLLDERIAKVEGDPNSGSTWPEVKSRGSED